jgi:phage/plasmid-associated DNA primase
MRTQNTSLGKILFKNGYYDFGRSVFVEGSIIGKEDKTENGYNPEIVFYNRIDHIFTEFSVEDNDYMETIRERLFTLSLGEDVGDYLIQNLARGLAGDQMKKILFGLGMSNSGKGILTKGCQLSMGQYCGTFTAENLAFNNSNNDEAQKMRWALLLKSKRLIISNEITNNKSLNGNMIKKLCSGGDTLQGRKHGEHEEEFIPQFLTIVLANDIPEIKPYDDAVQNRVRVYSYTKSFVDEPANEYELRKDPNLEKEMQTLQFQRCFIGLLIKSYLSFQHNKRIENEPEQVIVAKTEWMGSKEENDIFNKFQQKYEFTNDIDDYVLSEDIKNWVVGTKEMSFMKFVMDLKKYAVINKYENILNKPKKIKKVNYQAWRGIKLISTQMKVEGLNIEDMEEEE